MKGLASFLALLKGDAQADRVVPPSGFTARLTFLTAAAMAFLAVFALALSLAAGRVASEWSEALARSSTIRISAPIAQLDAQANAVLEVLRTTPGVAEARMLSPEEQAALLEPWLGPDLPIETLPVPRLIEVIETAEGYSPDGLRLRLVAEAPGAVLDDHTRWRRPLIKAAGRLRLLGWLSLVLIFGTMGGMITLAANAALAANAQVITVLRLVGARDTYIAGAFMRRFTRRAGTGALIGTAFGMLTMAVLPTEGTESFLTGLGFQGMGWVAPVFIPPLGAAVALFATRAAAFRSLKDLS